jgi:hypothetical protein
LGAKTKRAVLLFPRQTDDRFQKRRATTLPAARMSVTKTDRYGAADRSIQVLCQKRCWVFDAYQRHGEAVYMPAKHSTFNRSRFVLV